jgi:hypothetical protein
MFARRVLEPTAHTEWSTELGEVRNRSMLAEIPFSSYTGFF